MAANTAAVTTAVSNLRTQLAQVIQSAGLNASTFDPLGMPFRTNLQGYDFVLENVVVTVGPDGKTQLNVAPTYLPPLSGSWQLSLFDQDEPGDNFTSSTLRPASVVPNLINVQTASLATLVNPLIEWDAFEGKTATLSGNTMTITGPGTNHTVVINSFSVGHYQSCGTCGVGSTVSYRMTFNITANGPLEGIAFNNETSTITLVVRYQRVN